MCTQQSKINEISQSYSCRGRNRRENPYTPGFGGSPPVFAGRTREVSDVMKMTQRIVSDQSYAEEVILYGPRGNGKTTLLNHMAKQLKGACSGIHSIIVSPPDVKTRDEVYHALLERSISTEEARSATTGASAGITSFLRLRRDRETTTTFEKTLAVLKKECITKAAERPTLLLVDEAQRLTSDALDAILGITAAARRGETKFGFILAGTPGLPAHLGALDVAYLNRVPRIRLDRLDSDETWSALSSPLAKSGYEFLLKEEEKLDLIEQTKCYPHFIQCIGHAVWEARNEIDREHIDSKVLALARPKWIRQIHAVYEDRLRELRDGNFVDHAFAVARAYSEDRHSLHFNEIKNIIDECDENSDSTAVVAGLNAMGYIWESEENALLFEPGIPALMDHILTRMPGSGSHAPSL